MLVVRIDMFSFFKTNKLTCCGNTIVAIFKSLHNVEGFYTTSLQINKTVLQIRIGIQFAIQMNILNKPDPDPVYSLTNSKTDFKNFENLTNVLSVNIMNKPTVGSGSGKTVRIGWIFFMYYMYSHLSKTGFLYLQHNRKVRSSQTRR